MLEYLFKISVLGAILSISLKAYYYSLYKDNKELPPSFSGFLRYFILGVTSVVTFTAGLPFIIRDSGETHYQLERLKKIRIYLYLFWSFFILAMTSGIWWRLTE